MKKLFAVLLTLVLLCSAVSALAEAWTCAGCGKESEGNFCSWCGSPKPPEKVTCPNCGTEFDADAGYAFCNNCGAALKQEPSPAAVAVGDIIPFGSYEQDNNPGNGKETLEWIVLDVQDGKALLLSRYGLEGKPYNTSEGDITWEKCTLRNWLNSEFLITAFSAEEQSAILTTDVDNSAAQGYSEWTTSGGNNTKDKVFLLSYAEAGRYLNVRYWEEEDSQNKEACVTLTPYAIETGAYVVGEPDTGWWWLRSPGDDQSDGMDVNSDGAIHACVVDSIYGAVRPVIRVSLESILP